MLEKNDWAAAGVQTAASRPAAHAAPARKRANIARPRMIEYWVLDSIPLEAELGTLQAAGRLSTACAVVSAELPLVLLKSRCHRMAATEPAANRNMVPPTGPNLVTHHRMPL